MRAGHRARIRNDTGTGCSAGVLWSYSQPYSHHVSITWESRSKHAMQAYLVITSHSSKDTPGSGMLIIVRRGQRRHLEHDLAQLVDSSSHKSRISLVRQTDRGPVEGHMHYSSSYHPNPYLGKNADDIRRMENAGQFSSFGHCSW